MGSRRRPTVARPVEIYKALYEKEKAKRKDLEKKLILLVKYIKKTRPKKKG